MGVSCTSITVVLLRVSIGYLPTLRFWTPQQGADVACLAPGVYDQPTPCRAAQERMFSCCTSCLNVKLN